MDNYSTTFYTLEQGFPTIFYALTQNNFYILRKPSLIKRLQAKKMKHPGAQFHYRQIKYNLLTPYLLHGAESFLRS